MKKIYPYLPYFFYVFALMTFIIPSVYLKEEGKIIGTYSFLELTFGKDVFDFSLGLFIVLVLFIFTIVASIIIKNKDNNALTNITIILGLSTGVLTFFQRLLSTPDSTTYGVFIGLFLPGILILIGTLLLFINKKIIKQKG